MRLSDTVRLSPDRDIISHKSSMNIAAMSSQSIDIQTDNADRYNEDVSRSLKLYKRVRQMLRVSHLTDL